VEFRNHFLIHALDEHREYLAMAGIHKHQVVGGQLDGRMQEHSGGLPEWHLVVGTRC